MRDFVLVDPTGVLWRVAQNIPDGKAATDGVKLSRQHLRDGWAARRGDFDYLNWTPQRLPFAHTTLHIRRERSGNTNSNVAGIP